MIQIIIEKTVAGFTLWANGERLRTYSPRGLNRAQEDCQMILWLLHSLEYEVQVTTPSGLGWPEWAFVGPEGADPPS